jgi:hypothetical protein
MERATRATHDYASQLIGQMLDAILGGVARRSRNNSFVKISYRSTPFYPEPLPGINEESLIRERICERCRLHYAVYGEHRFCPVCGPLPAMTVALDAIAADETRLDALANLPAEALRPLRETWPDPLPSTDADRGADRNGRNENDEEMARWVRCTST